MNIYDILPKELWISIILELPCRYIYNFRDIDDISKDLCDTENLIHKRKMKGFPRMNGCYKHHNVLGCEGNVRGRKLELYNIAENLDDLIRGDFVSLKNSRTSQLFIFNGEKILNDSIMVNFELILPNEFDPINDNVSIKYWEFHSTNINFSVNIFSLREQILTNISIVNDIIFTSFLSNNIKHVIVSGICKETSTFKKGLSSVYSLRLHYNPNYVFQIDDVTVPNVYITRSLFY